MSYTQNYSTSIHISGSRTVSYPASQSGGSVTAHFEHTEPINISIFVDTDRFDSSVSRCEGAVDLLTGSVVAMNGAQCAAIKASGDEISKHIIDGFYSSINSELSQQLQALDSAIKAGFGLILEQGKAVSAQKETLQADYARISSRYITLFEDLDKECYKRIYALDKSAFTIAEKVQKQLVSDAVTNETAKTLLEITDESASKEIIFSSRLKRNALEVLKTLSEYISQEKTISAQIKSFVSGESLEQPKTLFIPLIWTSTDDLSGEGETAAAAVNGELPDGQKQAVLQAASSFFPGLSASQWEAPADGEKADLDREFKTLAEDAFTGVSDEKELRVYAAIMDLWGKSSLVTPKETPNE